MGKFEIFAANILAAVALLVLLVSVPAHAGEAENNAALDAIAVQYGRTIAVGKCSRCHAIGADDESKLPIAPAFRTLHKRYDVETLAEALVEGIVTGHDAMPAFEFSAEDAGSLISYLKSLE